jgi:hypothetical protein
MPKINPYLIPKENLPKTEEVRYLNTEIPSYEEFMKTYDYDEALMASYEAEINAQERGYGPCQNSSCNCSCSAYNCICNNYAEYQGGLVKKGKIHKIGGKKVNVRGFQHLIHTGNDWADKNNAPTRTLRNELWDERIGADSSSGEFGFNDIRTSAGVNRGIGGAIASGGGEYSMFKINGPKGPSSSEGIRFVSGQIGGEIGVGPGGITAGYTANIDLASVQAGGFQASVGYDAGSGVSFGPGGVEAKVAGIGFSVGKKMGISLGFASASIDLEETCSIQ